MPDTSSRFKVFKELSTAQICLGKQKLKVRKGLIDFECNTHFEFNGHQTFIEYHNHLDRLYALFKVEVIKKLNGLDKTGRSFLKLELQTVIDELNGHLTYKNVDKALSRVEVCCTRDDISPEELVLLKSKTKEFLSAQVSCFSKVKKFIRRHIIEETVAPRRKKSIPGQKKFDFDTDAPLIQHSMGKYQLVELVVALHSTGVIPGTRAEFYRNLSSVFGVDLSKAENTLSKLRARKPGFTPFIKMMESGFLDVLAKDD